jgi:hypothetical protein
MCYFSFRHTTENIHREEKGMKKREKADERVLEIAKNHLIAELILRDSRSSRAKQSAKKVIKKITPAKLGALGLDTNSKVFLHAMRIAVKERKKKKNKTFRLNPFMFFVQAKKTIVQ